MGVEAARELASSEEALARAIAVARAECAGMCDARAAAIAALRNAMREGGPQLAAMRGDLAQRRDELAHLRSFAQGGEA